MKFSFVNYNNMKNAKFASWKLEEVIYPKGKDHLFIYLFILKARLQNS